MFEPGVKVKTSQEYFDRTGRVVYGTVLKVYFDVPPSTVGVIWEKQEGNIDVRMGGLKVLMNKKDLVLDEN